MFLGLSIEWWVVFGFATTFLVGIGFSIRKTEFGKYLHESKLDTGLFVALLLVVLAQSYNHSQAQIATYRASKEASALAAERKWKLELEALSTFHSGMIAWGLALLDLRREEAVETLEGRDAEWLQKTSASRIRFNSMPQPATLIGAAEAIFLSDEVRVGMLAADASQSKFFNESAVGFRGPRSLAAYDQSLVTLFMDFFNQTNRVKEHMVAACRATGKKANISGGG